ncbi:hypothetical protein [Sphaerotilus sulfidivorans]|uniref:hypothetical protein n=1 Tax=Sphaerotilus sulfidivorans TaxID=639200 RepID=UPI003F6716A9
MIDVELFFNDCSLHGQFNSLDEFHAAVGRLMAMRQLAKNFGLEIYCRKNISQIAVTGTMSLIQAIQTSERDQRQALIQWVSRNGPFWDADRLHTEDDYLECDGNVVTDSAVGEAAVGVLNGLDRRLASIEPSCWLRTPLEVVCQDQADPKSVFLENYWSCSALESKLRVAPAEVNSWKMLQATVSRRFGGLLFSDDCFTPLIGLPFANGAAQQIMGLLDCLHRLTQAFDKNGTRTSSGHEIYRNYFAGDNARFTDSSDTEKNDFRKEMTFKHPLEAGGTLFCPWHGKIKYLQLRIHFSWPVRADEKIFVAYVGPKITKR